MAGPSAIVLFGATGDLATKKLIPAIYDLANRGLLAPGSGLVGFARRDWAAEHFQERVAEAVKEYSRTGFREDVWKQLLEGIRFVGGDLADDAAFAELSRVLAELDRTNGTGGNHAFYLSVPPAAFDMAVAQLRKHGLASKKDRSTPWHRVVIEKPFGHDLASARELERKLARAFDPASIFRIDHYLGKETVQNLLAFRFANTLFEPIWNRTYIDHVQITMAEDIGIAGRAGYYDGIGAARDVIQNHLLQLLALTAMEEPTSFNGIDLSLEKRKVLGAARVPADLSVHTARGQYAGGWAGGTQVAGYLAEDGIPADSTTETFAAIRVDIDNRRWAGVPFYLRTGKRLPHRVTEVALNLRAAPHLPFQGTDVRNLGTNALVLRIQPDEGVTLRFGAKVPATTMELRDVNMDFEYGTSFTESSPEAYERLLLDVLLGSEPLFPRPEEVELSWQILDPVLEHWAEQRTAPESYPPGTWGPTSADRMLARDGFSWRRP
jgi:glucose-6-phosphate 1-dehydrogenase